jgi:hypothetical protein
MSDEVLSENVALRKWKDEACQTLIEAGMLAGRQGALISEMKEKVSEATAMLQDCNEAMLRAVEQRKRLRARILTLKTMLSDAGLPVGDEPDDSAPEGK